MDEDSNINLHLGDDRMTLKGRTSVEHRGSMDWSSTVTETYLDIYVDKLFTGELVYYTGCAFASETVITSLEFIEEENAMVKLSERVTTKEDIEQFRDYNIKQENTNMNTANTVRELTITLIDTNVNLDDNNRIVYQKKGVMTTSSNEEVKMELLMSGEVKPALDEHNAKRVETIDGEFLDKHGRDVSLKPVKHISDPQLQWRFVETA